MGAVFSVCSSLWAEPVVLQGIVKPLHDVELSAAVEGRLEKILLAEGQTVKKDEVLLQMDDTLQALDVKRKAMIQKDRSQLLALQKNMTIMRDLVEKKKSLYEGTKAISSSELNRFVMQLTKAEGDLASVQANEEREVIEHDIAVAMLEMYKIKSPISGRVVEHYKEEGEWLRVGDPVVRVVDGSKCYVELDLEIEQVLAFMLNPKLSLEVPNGQEVLLLEGRVEFLSSIADSGSGLVRSKVSFDNPKGLVIPGVTARVILEL